MDQSRILKDRNYKPAAMLDQVLEKLNLKNDAALAKALDVTRAAISKVRNKVLPLGPSMLICLHEETGYTIGQLREMAGLPARMYVAG